MFFVLQIFNISLTPRTITTDIYIGLDWICRLANLKYKRQNRCVRHILLPPVARATIGGRRGQVTSCYQLRGELGPGPD